MASNKKASANQNVYKFGSGQYYVRFAESPDVIWLVDGTGKKIYPFGSSKADTDEAFLAFTGKTPAEYSSYITTVPSTLISPNGALTQDGYSAVELGKGINKTGKNLSDFSSGLTLTKYGKKTDANTDLAARNGVIQTINLMYNDPNSTIPKDFLKRIGTDSKALAFYGNAIGYGGYTPAQIYQDVAKRYKSENGDSSLDNVTVIDQNKSWDDYKNTNEGSQAFYNDKLALPPFISYVDTSLLKMPIYESYDKLFNPDYKAIDPNSETFKEKVNQVKTLYADAMIQMLDANTQQESDSAKYLFEQANTLAKEQLGITLSNNATQAWTQLDGLNQQMGQRNLLNSGILAEARDKYLNMVRKQDSLSRKNNLTDEEQRKYNYYRTSASPEEIASLSDAERKKYGLQASDDLKNYFNESNLKNLYPDASDEEIKAMINLAIDDNGNMRSSLYSNYVSNRYKQDQERQQIKTDTAIGQIQQDEKKAFNEFNSGANSPTEDITDVIDLPSVTDPGKVEVIPGKKSSLSDVPKESIDPTNGIYVYVKNNKTGEVKKVIASTAKNKVGTGDWAYSTSAKTSTSTTPQSTPTQSSGYKIQSGDSLSKIASKNGTTVSAIMAANPSIKDANKIMAGQSITIPSATTTQKTTTTTPVATQTTQTSTPSTYGVPKAKTDVSLTTIYSNTGSPTQVRSDEVGNYVKMGYSTSKPAAKTSTISTSTQTPTNMTANQKNNLASGAATLTNGVYTPKGQKPQTGFQKILDNRAKKAALK